MNSLTTIAAVLKVTFFLIQLVKTQQRKIKKDKNVQRRVLQQKDPYKCLCYLYLHKRILRPIFLLVILFLNKMKAEEQTQ